MQYLLLGIFSFFIDKRGGLGIWLFVNVKSTIDIWLFMDLVIWKSEINNHHSTILNQKVYPSKNCVLNPRDCMLFLQF